MERIRTALQRALAPEHLEIIDDGAAHVGHPGARAGGHFRVVIIAEGFRGQTARQRHQAVYAALGELLKTDVHAVNIRALAPEDVGDSEERR